jgi:uncharacterized protein YkwD
VKSNWKILIPAIGLLIGFSLSACLSEPVKSTINPISSSIGLEIIPTSEPQIPVKTPSLNPESTAITKVDPTVSTDAKATPTLVIYPTLLPNPPGEGLSGCLAVGNPTFEEETLALVNQEREKKSLPPLAMNNHLVAAARAHSADMACRNYFSHQGSDGSTSFERMESNGYKMSYAGENIYAGPEQFNTPTQAVRHWMNSPSHRASILNPDYTEAGVGYYYFKPAVYDGYFTIDFASPALIETQSADN